MHVYVIYNDKFCKIITYVCHSCVGCSLPYCLKDTYYFTIMQDDSIYYTFIYRITSGINNPKIPTVILPLKYYIKIVFHVVFFLPEYKFINSSIYLHVSSCLMWCYLVWDQLPVAMLN